VELAESPEVPLRRSPIIKKIAFVAHPTRDLEAAKAFFGDVVGLETDDIEAEVAPDRA